MDFKSMKRKELQALCKKNGLPANSTNAQMIESLSSVLQVKLKGCLKGFGGSSGEVLGVSRGGPKKVSFVVEDGNEEDSENFARKPSAKSKRKSFVKSSSVSPGLRRSSKETGTGSAAEVPQRITRARRLSSAVLWSPIIEKKNSILKESTESVRYNVEQSLVKKMDFFGEVPTTRTLRSRVVVASGDEELATDIRTQNRKGSVKNEDNENVVALPEKNLHKRPRDESVVEDEPPRRRPGRTQGKLKETVNIEEVDGGRSRKRRKGDLGVGFVDKVVDQEIGRPAGPGRSSKRLRGSSTASMSDNVVEMEPTRRSTRSSSIIKEVDTSLPVSKKSVNEGELVTKAKSQKQAENGALEGKKQEDEISATVEAGQKGKLRRQARNCGSKRGESTQCTSKLLMDEATLPTRQKLRGDSEAERRVKPIKQPKKRPLECAGTTVSLLDDGAEAVSTKRATRSASKLLGNEASPVVGKLGYEINDRNKVVKSRKHATYSASKQGALTADSEAVSTPARRLTHSSPKLLGDISSIPVIGKLIDDTVGKDKSVTRVQTSTSKSRDSTVASVKKEDSTTLTRRPTRSSLQLEDGSSSAPKLGSLVNEAVSTPKRRATRSTAQQLEDVFSESAVERFGGDTDTVRKNKSGKQATRSALKSNNSSTLFSANKAEITPDRRPTRSSLKLLEEETSHALKQGDLPALLSDNKAEAIPARRSMRSSSKMSEDVTRSALFPNSEAVTAHTRRSTSSSLKMPKDVSSTPVVGKLGDDTVGRDKLVTQVKTRASTVVLMKNEDSTTQTRRSTPTSLQLEDGTSSSPKLPSLLPDNKSVSTSISRATHCSVQQVVDVSSASVVRRLDSVSDTDRSNKSGKQETKSALKGGDSSTLFSANKSAITPARRLTRSSLKLLEGASHVSEQGDLPALLSDSKAEIMPARRSMCSSSKLSEDVPYTSVVGNSDASENADSADPLLDNSLVESENLIDDSEAIRKDKSGEQSNNHALEQGGSAALLNCPSMHHLMEDEITPLLHVELGDDNVEGQKNLLDRSERESDPENNAMKDSGPGSQVEVLLEVEYGCVTHLDGMTSHSDQYRSEALLPVGQNLGYETEVRYDGVTLSDGMTSHSEQYQTEGLLPGGQNLVYDEAKVQDDGATQLDGMPSHSELNLGKDLLPADHIFGDESEVIKETELIEEVDEEPSLSLGVEAANEDVMTHGEVQQLPVSPAAEDALAINAAEDCPLVYLEGSNKEGVIHHVSQDGLLGNEAPGVGSLPLARKSSDLSLVHDTEASSQTGPEHPYPKVEFDGQYEDLMTSDNEVLHEDPYNVVVGEPDTEVEVRDVSSMEKSGAINCDELLVLSPSLINEASPRDQEDLYLEVDICDSSKMTSHGGSSITAGEDNSKLRCDELPLHELPLHGEYSGELSPTLINEASPVNEDDFDLEVDIHDSSKMASHGGSSINAGEESSKGVEVPTMLADDAGNLSNLRGIFDSDMEGCKADSDAPLSVQLVLEECSVLKESEETFGGNTGLYSSEAGGEEALETYTSTTLSVTVNDDTEINGNGIDRERNGVEVGPSISVLSPANLMNEPEVQLSEESLDLVDAKDIHGSEKHDAVESGGYEKPTEPCSPTGSPAVGLEEHGKESLPGLRLHEVQLFEESLDLEVPIDVHGSEEPNAVESGGDEEASGPCSPTGTPAVGLQDHGKQSLPVAAVDSHFGAEQSDTTQMFKGRNEDSVDAEENSSDSFVEKLFKEKDLFLSTAGFTVVDRALNVQPMESITKFAGISCETTEGKSSIDYGDAVQLQDSSTPKKLMDNEGSVDSVYVEIRAPSALTGDNAVLSESEVRVDEARRASHPSVSCAEESLSMSGTESCAILGFEGSTIQDIVQDVEGTSYLSEQDRDTVNVAGSLNVDSVDKSPKSAPKFLWSLGNKQPNVVSDDLVEASNTAGISCKTTEGKSSIDYGDADQLQDSSTPTKLMDNEGSVDAVYVEFRAPSALTVDNAVLSESEVGVEARRASRPSVSCAEESLSMSGTESCAMLGFEGSTNQDIVQDVEGTSYLSEQDRDTVNVAGSLNVDSVDKSLKSAPKFLWSLGNKQPNVVSDDLVEASTTAVALNHSDSERHSEQVEVVGEEMENMDPLEGETSGENNDDTSMERAYNTVLDEIDHISEVAQKPNQHILLHETEDCSGETRAIAIPYATENAEGNDERAAAEEETGVHEESEPVSLFPLAKVQEGQDTESSSIANETSSGQGLGLAEGPGADHADISDLSFTDKEAEKKVVLILPCNRDVDLKEEGSFSPSEEANDQCSAEIFLLKTDSFSEATEHASPSDSGRKTNIIHHDIFSCKEVREEEICIVGGREIVNRHEEGDDPLSEPVTEDTYHADIDNDLKLAKNSDCSHSVFPSTEATKSEHSEDHSSSTPVEDTRESGIKESNEIIKESLVADQPLIVRQELFGSTVEDLPETATTEQDVSLVQFDQTTSLGDDATGCRGPSETGLNFQNFEESAEIQNDDGIDCSSSKDHTQQSNQYQVKFEKYEQPPTVQESWVASGAMEWSVEELFHMDTDMEAQVGQWECRVHKDYGRTDSGNYEELNNAETSLTAKEDMKAMAANLSGESPEACYSREKSLKADTLSYTSFENYLAMNYPAAGPTSPGKCLSQVTDDINKSVGNELEGEPHTKDDQYLENSSDEEK